MNAAKMAEHYLVPLFREGGRIIPPRPSSQDQQQKEAANNSGRGNISGEELRAAVDDAMPRPSAEYLKFKNAHQPLPNLLSIDSERIAFL